MYLGTDSQPVLLSTRPTLAATDPSSPLPMSFAPRFCFHRTGEELVWYYLRRKACRKSFQFEVVSKIDIYKFEPWLLVGK